MKIWSHYSSINILLTPQCLHNKIRSSFTKPTLMSFFKSCSVCSISLSPWPGNALLLCVSANPVCLWIPHPFWKYYQSIWTASNPSFPGTNSKPPALAFCFYISHSRAWQCDSKRSEGCHCQDQPLKLLVRSQGSMQGTQGEENDQRCLVPRLYVKLYHSFQLSCGWSRSWKEVEKNKPIVQSPEMKVFVREAKVIYLNSAFSFAFIRHL